MPPIFCIFLLLLTVSKNVNKLTKIQVGCHEKTNIFFCLKINICHWKAFLIDLKSRKSFGWKCCIWGFEFSFSKKFWSKTFIFLLERAFVRKMQFSLIWKTICQTFFRLKRTYQSLSILYLYLSSTTVHADLVICKR